MLAYFLLLSITSVVFGQWTGDIQGVPVVGNEDHRVSEYPFLEGLNDTAKAQFLEMADSSVLTRGERRLKMDLWAASHGLAVLTRYNTYQADLATARSNYVLSRQARVATFSPAGQSAIAELDGIANNLALTDRQAQEEELRVLSGLPVEVRREVESVSLKKQAPLIQAATLQAAELLKKRE